MMIIIPVLLPLVCALLLLVFADKHKAVAPVLTLFAVLGSFLAVVMLFLEPFGIFYISWVDPYINLSFSTNQFSRTLLAAATLFSLWVLIYSFYVEIEYKKWFYFSFLTTLSFVCGAMLADNLILMLFFWEGLLIPLYLFIVLNRGAKETAYKAFIINAVGDIFLLSGIVLTGAIAGTFETSTLITMPISLQTAPGIIALLLIAVGALAKAGAVPFHSWIPEAAQTTNAAFMAFLPGALEKLLAVFLLGKILMVFDVAAQPGCGDILFVLAIFSIIIATVMIIKETDLKKFIAYNVVLQIGLLALEQSANMTADIITLANHGIYKAAALACLFMCAGIIEKAAGKTDIKKLGGLFKPLPSTSICFILASMALTKITYIDVFAAADFYGIGQNNKYLLAFLLISHILVLSAFIRVIFNTFFGSVRRAALKKVPFLMSAMPMKFTFFIILFSIGWVFDENQIFNLSHAHFSFSWISGAVLLSLPAALVLAFAKYKRNGIRDAGIFEHSGYVDRFYGFIHRLDLYENIKFIMLKISGILFKTDRVFDFIIDEIPSTVARRFSKKGSRLHSGYHLSYILWAIIGAVVFAVIALSGGWM